LNFSEKFLKTANRTLDFFVMLTLVLITVYAAYALWDNGMVYAAAENVQLEMQQLKPTEENGHSFEELLKINPDVVAWVTLDDTNIDYPIVQGKDNMEYVNKNVYGDFALAGSIFLDSRNDRHFTDTYSLLYGHNMAEGKMFGDLQLYKEKEFFDAHLKGQLILPDTSYDLEIFSAILVNSSDDYIFDPNAWDGDIEPLLQYAEEESLFLQRDIFEKVQGLNGEAQILALTTCTYEFTDARTVLLAYMVPKNGGGAQ